MNLCFIIQVPKNFSDAPQLTRTQVGFPHMQVRMSGKRGLEWEGGTFIRRKDRWKHACVRGPGFVEGTTGRPLQTPV